MSDHPLRILVIGAHPDDCEFRVGGTAALWRRGGHVVRFVSATDGSAGHHEMGGAALVARRRAEAEAAAAVIGAEVCILDTPDGHLEPSLTNRHAFVRLIREFRPDLVITHRPWDYHPDHRYTAALVQDAAYMVTVPSVCPTVPHLEANPAVVYMADEFEKPYPLRADVSVDIDAVIDLKGAMLHAHTSQMYEWLPYNMGIIASVPDDDAARRAQLDRWHRPLDAAGADRFRDRLVALYGEKHGQAVRHAESYEWCEYGAPLTDERRDRLFPFVRSPS